VWIVGVLSFVRSVCEREHGAFSWDATVGGHPEFDSMCFLFSKCSVVIKTS
jgi:hypothetical protein